MFLLGRQSPTLTGLGGGVGVAYSNPSKTHQQFNIIKEMRSAGYTETILCFDPINPSTDFEIQIHIATNERKSNKGESLSSADVQMVFFQTFKIKRNHIGTILNTKSKVSLRAKRTRNQFERLRSNNLFEKPEL